MGKFLTSRSEDYSQWYNELVVKAGLAEQSVVRGCMVIKPYGYAIWEKIQRQLDDMFKQTGHVNAYFPLLIPKSFFSKEADHVEGFAKECAVVTHYRLKNDPNGGGVVVDPAAKLEEEYIIRPTSETIIWNTYKNWIQSYRDLPILCNQWANVMRWEMRTRMFLRTAEFLWQEGHTAHATKEEALEEANKMVRVYAGFAQNWMAVPVIMGSKSESERFAGALETFTIEALMHDGKALQAGTSHYFGDGFAKAFNIQFTDKNNTLQYPHQTSWGVTTRLIGALIMVHGDNSGLVLPPKVAPTQVVIIPIQQRKEGVLDKAYELKDRLSNFRVKVDDTDKSPGWKFAEAEMRGIPVRVEIGPKDIEAGKCVLARRDTGEKLECALDELEAKIAELMETIQKDMLEKARKHRESHTYVAKNMEEMGNILNNTPGFVKAMWCGCQECEDKIKEQFAATSRCMPFEQETLSDTCVCCGKPAKKMVYWGKAY